MSNETIEYYNHNAKAYFDRTIVIDVEAHYTRFIKFVTPGAYILDAGSGSGRDTKHFLDLGYRVMGMDASLEMAKISSAYTGIPTLHLTFEEMAFTDTFDAVWSSASLLHIPPNLLPGVLQNIKRALKENGIWFLSFNYGDFVGLRQERYYHNLTEETLKKYLDALGDMEVLDLFKTKACERGSDIEWLQCIVRKRQQNSCKSSLP